MAAKSRKIGRVVSVSGAQIIALLDDRKSGNGSADLPPTQIGGLVKVHTPASTVYGMISGLSIPIPAQDEGASEMKIAEFEAIGESLNGANGSPASFRRGVSVFPELGDDVLATTKEDLSHVYARPAVPSIGIGTVHQDRSLPAFLITDDLLGKHFAILGTTGSGKSCAVALILHALLEQNPNAHVVVLDPHNEYAHAFGDVAEVIDPDTLELPYWLLTLEEMVEVALSSKGDERAADAAVLSELILQCKQEFPGNADIAETLIVDTPVPYRLGDLTRLINEAMGKLGGKPDALAPYQRLKARFKTLETDRRFAFMFEGLNVRDNMVKVLSRIFRVPVCGKPISIINLSGVPSEILNVVVSVLCRMTFDLALWSDRAVPTLLVCEEAHRYAPQDTALGFEPTKRALSRIAKEGRKYGVSLCVVSQRPSDLATDILSQCNTIFALRLTNQKDQEFVRSAMSESTVGLIDSLPSLLNTEAIVVGEGVSVPMRMCFNNLSEDRRPLSGTAGFAAAWQEDQQSDIFLEEIVDRWRRQRR